MELHVYLFICVTCLNFSKSSGQTCGEKFDLVFIVDSSGSIRDNNPRDGSYDNWQLIQNFLSNVTDILEIGQDGVKVGLVEFSNDARLSFPLLDNEVEIKAEIGMLPYLGGFTNTSGGLRWMLEVYSGFDHDTVYGTRPDVRDVALLITDGYSNVDKERTLLDAYEAHDLGIELFTVGVTSLVNVTEVKLMSSMPQLENQTYWLLPDFQNLPTILESMSSKLCAGIEEFPTSFPSNDSHIFITANGNDIRESTTLRSGSNVRSSSSILMADHTAVYKTENATVITNTEEAWSIADSYSNKSTTNTKYTTVSNLENSEIVSTDPGHNNNVLTNITADAVNGGNNSLSDSDTVNNSNSPTVIPSRSGVFVNTNLANTSTNSGKDIQSATSSTASNALLTSTGEANDSTKFEISTPGARDSDRLMSTTLMVSKKVTEMASQEIDVTSSGNIKTADFTFTGATDSLRTALTSEGSDVVTVEPQYIILYREPTAQALIDDESVIIGLGFLGFVLFVLLMVIIALLWCCCCCKITCLGAICGGCATKSGYCADNCVCCGSSVHCGSCATIFCCSCCAYFLAWLCCCCCWIGGGDVYRKRRHWSTSTVAPSEKGIIIDGDYVEWEERPIITPKRKTGRVATNKTTNLPLTADISKKSPLTFEAQTQTLERNSKAPTKCNTMKLTSAANSKEISAHPQMACTMPCTMTASQVCKPCYSGVIHECSTYCNSHARGMHEICYNHMSGHNTRSLDYGNNCSYPCLGNAIRVTQNNDHNSKQYNHCSGASREKTNDSNYVRSTTREDHCAHDLPNKEHANMKCKMQIIYLEPKRYNESSA